MARFEFHFLQSFLHILGDGGFFFCPFMSNIDLHSILLLFSQTIVVSPDISQLHSALLLTIISKVKLVALFIFLFSVLWNSLTVYRVLRFQFIGYLFRRLVIIRLFWLFTKSTHFLLTFIRLVLFLILDRLSLRWWRLSLNRRKWSSFLSGLHWFFFMLLFFWLIFWWNWVEYSWWFDFLPIISKDSDLYWFFLVLFQSFSRIFQLLMNSSLIISIGF